MDKTVKVLVLLVAVYISIFIVSYSRFLQIPVFLNSSLMWGALVEQYLTWLPLIITYAFLLKTVTRCSLIPDPVVEDQRLVAPGILFIFLSGFSLGVHALAQVLEDMLQPEAATYVYTILLIMDEIVGHLFLVFLTLVLFLFVLAEINRRPHTLKKSELLLMSIISPVGGILWGISAVEGGSMYLATIPIVAVLLYRLFGEMKRHDLQLKNYPFTYFYIVSSIVLVIFSIFWVFIYGWFVQPSTFNLTLFRF